MRDWIFYIILILMLLRLNFALNVIARNQAVLAKQQWIIHGKDKGKPS